MKMNQLIPLLWIPVMLTACNPSKNGNAETPNESVEATLHQTTEQTNPEKTNTDEPVNAELADEPAPGILKFNEGDIALDLDLNGKDQNVFSKDYQSRIGPIGEMFLSPNRQFLAIGTGQGGAGGIMIYHLPQNKMYILGSFHATFEWLPDNRLKISDQNVFGKYPDKEFGEIGAIYESISSEKPWEIDRK